MFLRRNDMFNVKKAALNVTQLTAVANKSAVDWLKKDRGAIATEFKAAWEAGSRGIKPTRPCKHESAEFVSIERPDPSKWTDAQLREYLGIDS
jgi:hypothetical protein